MQGRGTVASLRMHRRARCSPAASLKLIRQHTQPDNCIWQSPAPCRTERGRTRQGRHERLAFHYVLPASGVHVSCMHASPVPSESAVSKDMVIYHDQRFECLEYSASRSLNLREPLDLVHVKSGVHCACVLYIRPFTAPRVRCTEA